MSIPFLSDRPEREEIELLVKEIKGIMHAVFEASPLEVNLCPF